MMRFAVFGAMLLSFAALSSGQTDAPAKTPVSMEELNFLDQKFHKQLNAAQEAADQEKFAEAELCFSQLAAEIDHLLERIAVSVFPRYSVLEIDGVKQAATVQSESEWFGLAAEKAKRGKLESGILANIAAIQDEGSVLLRAGKYPEDLETYRRSAQVLAARRSELSETNFTFFLDRACRGERSASSLHWAAQYKTLRNRYNATTGGGMNPEEIRKTIQSVAGEIRSKGYLDTAKHTDMPEDTRSSFKMLSQTAQSFLAQ